MEAWLSKRYEVYAKRDFSYIERLKREIESENGCLELLFEKDTLAGMKAYWGMDKPEERLLFVKKITVGFREMLLLPLWEELSICRSFFPVSV